ncbi:hypothetical protein FSP39_006366 [Pinctada imbricata]|uniref:IgGFc-binding protein N-terminal domain-containing protein n=1 Tax=Pinctada imbricata TaxID=66713 RepID=A0AA88Y2M4_PINIB|nr:hypothetical protein FSP39_006366 [Pinctada imbricata]
MIGYMENAESRNFDVELFVTTARKAPVTVRVQAQDTNNASLDVTFTVTAGGVKQLFIDNSYRNIKTGMSQKGILVTSSDEIVIYGVNKERNSNDAFLGLPTDVIGTEYYATTYAPATRYCLILVVGVHDNTTVEITFPDQADVNITYDGQWYGPNSKLTLKMHRFSTFQAHNVGDLTGTYVKSDKPVSFFSGNKKTKIGPGNSQDHLVEQQVPVSRWGRKFAIMPVPDRVVGDYFRFVASEENTTVTVRGQNQGQSFEESFTLASPGDWIQKNYSSTSFSYVESSKAILLVQYVLSMVSDNADPAMFIIPPIEQYAADYTFTTPKWTGGNQGRSDPNVTEYSYFNYFMFVVKDSEKYGLRMDGRRLPSNTEYNIIPGTDLVAGYVSLTDGTHICRHISPISVFGGYLYGRQRLESYAFPSGMRLAPINAPCTKTTTGPGDGLDNDCDGLIDEELCYDDGQGIGMVQYYS